jgi:hypothetical protein
MKSESDEAISWCNAAASRDFLVTQAADKEASSFSGLFAETNFLTCGTSYSVRLGHPVKDEEHETMRPAKIHHALNKFHSELAKSTVNGENNNTHSFIDTQRPTHLSEGARPPE